MPRQDASTLPRAAGAGAGGVTAADDRGSRITWLGVNGPDVFEIERTPLHPLVESLFARDPGGRSWLPGLLGAFAGASVLLGEIVDDPGYLEVPLAVRAQAGMLAC